MKSMFAFQTSFMHIELNDVAMISIAFFKKMERGGGGGSML